MAIQIGKYKRPGIFLEEFDKSVIATPIVEGITNMVIGVSKKGPINTPVRLTTVNDLEAIFGPLDRGLERKGSFFHRTVSKMLESAPVYAMNLLVTDDTLDVIEYKSLSGSADYINDIEREGPYRRFHDTTGFWKRDTESFVNLTKGNAGYDERAFSLTNLSDRYATVFMFKTARTGFDRTLIEWYGSAEKVPPYVNVNDFASDYMVDIVIVAGDWSNYSELAVDSRWSAYFNASGLLKGQVRNFSNDRNVTTLAYYEGVSLIPYFRDGNGTNVFIETIVNRDTDKTGIFCAFNNDLIETDYFNGKLDLIGHTIAGKNETNIEFLSYKETIAEEVELNGTPLDLPGNVTGFLGTHSVGGHGHAFGVTNPSNTGIVENGNRTAYFAEGYLHNIQTNAISVTYSAITAQFPKTNAGDNAYSIIGGQYIQLSGATLSISAGDYASSSSTASYVSAYVLDSTGTFKVVSSSNSSNPSVASTDVVLAYVSFDMVNQQITSATKSNVALKSNGYNHLISGADYTIEEVTAGTGDAIKVTFLNTASTPSTSSYEQYRRIKAFNELVDIIDNPNKDKATMLVDYTTMEKASLSGMSISSIVTSTSQNKSFVLSTGLSSAELADILNYQFLVIYSVDNEFIIGKKGVLTTNEAADPNEFGVAAKYSDFYAKFYDGAINTGDFFYGNLAGTYSYNVTFLPGEKELSGYNTGATYSSAGNDYIVFEGENASNLDLDIDQVVSIKGSALNTGSFTVTSVNVASSIIIGATTSKVYKVSENTVYEAVSGVSQINNHNTDGTHYLDMYLDENENIVVSFKNEALDAIESLSDITSANTIYIQSANSNYKQTIEIELPTGYTEIPNRILVNGSRYTEVRVGDFLEAYYDETALSIGEYPRKLTRVVSKKQYANNLSLVEISCDARINKKSAGAAYQTTAYKSVDAYASTYKAISLRGFRVREASLPNGTETRQNSILNIVAKGTPLFKALTNKEALDFRYLVDSFGLGLTERSKQQLLDICGDRLDAFAFVNMPSMKSFKNSTSPSFVDENGVLQMEYVSKGGNPESSPAFLYSFGDGAGTTCAGYFLPYLTVNDNGRPLEMPPASHVATTYMRKHNSNVGGITPWTIAAGVTNGRISNIAGLEMDFTLTDIEWLNQAQMNPIVFKRNRGNVIETENTAQTLYKSALSYIHVREVLIELERELSRMLLDFQWKFNTQDVRAEIKYRADIICEGFINQNGLYNYFNKMDEENNTPDIIDNQIGVLDTYVEPIRGMGIIVNNVTILRTGAIEAGGFQ